MTLVINLIGASESKAQMAVPCGTVSATVVVTPLFVPRSWKSLKAPKVCSAYVKFAVSKPTLAGLFLAQTHFCKYPWSGSAPEEVLALGLFLQRSLVLIFSLGNLRLG